MVLTYSSSLELNQFDTFLDHLAGGAAHAGDGAVGGRGQREFHLHRLQNKQHLAAFYRVTGLDQQAGDAAGNGRDHPPCPAGGGLGGCQGVDDLDDMVRAIEDDNEAG